MKRETRSSKYQYLLLEIPVDFSTKYHELIDESPNYNEDEERLDIIHEEALLLIVRLIRECLTQKQLVIFNLMLSGNTQVETAKALNLKNQSSVTKCLNGADYHSKTKTVKYGGIAKKIKPFVLNSEELKPLIKELYEGKRYFLPHLLESWFINHADFMAYFNIIISDEP